MSVPNNSTLYSPKYNFEYYNIHKNAQTSILNTFYHHDKKVKDRIFWYKINDLPSDRKIICVLRDIYDRAVSGFLYIIHWGRGQMNIRKLSQTACTKIMYNKNILQAFDYYLKEIKNNGFFDNHSLPQLYFLDNTIKDKYKSYKHSSDRNIKSVTHFMNFNKINKEFKLLFNIKLRNDNTTKKQLIPYKNIIMNNINYFKKI